MLSASTSKAAIPNPALKAFERIIGEWKTEGAHPLLPGVVFHGNSSFQWMEGGAFLIMHASFVEKEIPDGMAVIGSDQDSGGLFMLYFDERTVSRKYEMKLTESGFEWSRMNPEFSQRCEVRIMPDGKTLISKGWMSRNNGPWEDDLSLNYSRLK